MKTTLDTGIETTNRRIDRERENYLAALREVARSIDREIEAVEANPNAMPSTSSAGALMAMSRSDDAQRASDRLHNLSEQLSLLLHLRAEAE